MGVLLAGATVTLGGCAVAYQNFPSIDPRSPKEKQAEQFTRCSSRESREWDLGTGRLEDIASKAPDFYALGPNASFYQNERRAFLLRQASLPSGLTLADRPDKHQEIVDFSGRDSPPGQVVAFTNGRGVQVMIAPTSCPHVKVVDQCVDGRMQTSVELEGTVPCFMGRSVPFVIHGPGILDNVMIAPGGVQQLGNSGGAVHITLGDGLDRFFENMIPVDKFPNASPPTVLALLKNADDNRAYLAFRSMDPKWLTEEFKMGLRQARVEAISSRLSAWDLVQILHSTTLDPDYPGTREIMTILQPRIEQGIQLLASNPATGLGFWRGIVMLDKVASVTALDMSAFVDNYGAAISKGEIDGPAEAVEKIEVEFGQRWPESQYTTALQERRAREAKEREMAWKKSMDQSHLNNLWYEIRELGNEIVSWQYRVQWLRKNGPPTRRNQIGISNMEAGIKMKKQQFCGLKRDFLKDGTPANFRERAKEHCDDDAPVEDLGTGEVDLTAQCRVQFNGGC